MGEVMGPMKNKFVSWLGGPYDHSETVIFKLLLGTVKTELKNSCIISSENNMLHLNFSEHWSTKVDGCSKHKVFYLLSRGLPDKCVCIFLLYKCRCMVWGDKDYIMKWNCLCKSLLPAVIFLSIRIAMDNIYHLQNNDELSHTLSFLFS